MKTWETVVGSFVVVLKWNGSAWVGSLRPLGSRSEVVTLAASRKSRAIIAELTAEAIKRTAETFGTK